MGIRRTRTRLSWLTLALFLTGCASDFQRNGDPLTGAPPAPPTAPAAALGKPAPPPPALGTTAGSTAAVASGPVRPGSPNAGLRIAEAPAGTPAGISPPPPAPRLPGATLTAATSPTAPTSPLTPARALSYEQAQALLTSRGVKWQWLEMKQDTGEWRFMCRLPSKTNPNLSRTYEARGTTHLAAVQAVLDQMDREGVGSN